MVKFFARLIAILLIVGAVLLAYGLLLPAGPNEEKFVQLKPGSSAHRIAGDLKKAGIIRSQYAFLLVALLAWTQAAEGRRILRLTIRATVTRSL